MAKIDIKDATLRDEWDKFVTSHKEANFLQSWDFYEFHKIRGNMIVRRIAYKNNKIVGAYAGVVENAKRGRHLAIAGGPIIDWSDNQLTEAIFADMKNEGNVLFRQEKNSFRCQIERKSRIC